MQRFDLKDLSAWQRVELGEVLDFPASGQRRVRVQVMASDHVEVRATAPGGDPVLVGFGAGAFEVAFSCEGTAAVELSGEPGTEVWLSGFAPSHVVERTSDEVFTSVMPQGRRNSDYDRMMFAMRLNEERREAQLGREIESLRAAAREGTLRASEVSRRDAVELRATPGQEVAADDGSEADHAEVSAPVSGGDDGAEAS